MQEIKLITTIKRTKM